MNKTLVFSADYLAELKRRSEAGMAPSVEVGSNGAYTYYGSTNWYDLLYRDRVPSVDQNVSVSRGTENAQFMVSGAEPRTGRPVPVQLGRLHAEEPARERVGPRHELGGPP